MSDEYSPGCDCYYCEQEREAREETCVCGSPCAADNTGYCENCLEASEHEGCEICAEEAGETKP